MWDSQSQSFEGVIPNLKRRWKGTDSEWTRKELEKYMTIEVCPLCDGARLRAETLAITFQDKNIADITGFAASQAKDFFHEIITRDGKKNLQTMIALLKEIEQRFDFLCQVGLEYLTLDRSSTTLSGGEAQRVRLATQIGSSLTGVLYVLDEPSIGLHARDHARLLQTLKNLRDLGNTVLVVEHDPETMNAADWIIDIGPGAGIHGGKVIFEGTPKEIFKAKTLTGEYLSGKNKVYAQRKSDFQKEVGLAKKRFFYLKGASEKKLNNFYVKIKLGQIV